MKINNHLVTFAEWKDCTDYESYIFKDQIEINYYDAFRDTPSKEECDEMSEKLSGEVVVFKIN